MEFTEKIKRHNTDKSISSLCDLELIMGNEDQRQAFNLKLIDLQKNFPRIKYDLMGNAFGAGNNDPNALAAGESLPSTAFMMDWAQKYYGRFFGPEVPPGVAVQRDWDKLMADEEKRSVAVQAELGKLKGEAKEMGKLNETLKTKTSAPSRSNHNPSNLLEGPDKWKAEYDADAKLQKEFNSAESYLAYKKADAEGRIRHLRRHNSIKVNVNGKL